jgi:hypothetical protein
MKTTFVPTRGHHYHVIHETQTAGARVHARTICENYFPSGERSTRQPTCPDCVRLDNPLTLSLNTIEYLRAVATFKPWRDPPRNATYRRLVEIDLITTDVALTRRGAILAEDFTLGPVPMAAVSGIVHARKPLSDQPYCGMGGALVDTLEMTVSRYEKLRKLEDSVTVTCLTCIGT